MNDIDTIYAKVYTCKKCTQAVTWYTKERIFQKQCPECNLETVFEGLWATTNGITKKIS